MWTIQLLLVVSLLLIFAGIWSIHHVDKTSTITKRLSAVLLTMSGFATLWSAIAQSAPVIVNPRAEIINNSKHWIAVKASYESVRMCQISDFAVRLISEDKSVELQSGYVLINPDTSARNYSFIFINNPLDSSEFSVEHLEIDIIHQCPFGLKIKTTFPAIPANPAPLKRSD